MRLLASLAFAGFGAAVLPATAAPPTVTAGPWQRVGIAGVTPRSVGPRDPASLACVSAPGPRRRRRPAALVGRRGPQPARRAARPRRPPAPRAPVRSHPDECDDLTGAAATWPRA